MRLAKHRDSADLTFRRRLRPTQDNTQHSSTVKARMQSYGEHMRLYCRCFRSHTACRRGSAVLRDINRINKKRLEKGRIGQRREEAQMSERELALVGLGVGIGTHASQQAFFNPADFGNDPQTLSLSGYSAYTPIIVRSRTVPLDAHVERDHGRTRRA